MSVDTIDINDGMFHAIHDQFLAGGGVYEMPFNNYFSFSSTGGLSQTTNSLYPLNLQIGYGPHSFLVLLMQLTM
jgi:hypothetical protein